jgi:hypothetical protein
MITLEFRLPANLDAASKILDTQNLSYKVDVSLDGCRPSVIYFFENAIRTETQREALRQARSVEKKDHHQWKSSPSLNLAATL